jgi:hypothetical protein
LVEQVLWSTFGVHDVVVVVEDPDGRHSSEVLVKWKHSHFWQVLVSLDDLLWHVDVVVDEEFDHADFKGLSLWLILELFIVHFNSDVVVVHDVVDDCLLKSTGKLCVLDQTLLELLSGGVTADGLVIIRLGNMSLIGFSIMVIFVVLVSLLVVGWNLVSDLVSSYLKLAGGQDACLTNAQVMQHGS